jgi:hypothetical protein
MQRAKLARSNARGAGERAEFSPHAILVRTCLAEASLFESVTLEGREVVARSAVWKKFQEQQPNVDPSNRRRNFNVGISAAGLIQLSSEGVDYLAGPQL